MGSLRSPRLTAHRSVFLQGSGWVSGEKGLLTQSMVVLGDPTGCLGGTAQGSEALRWKGWLPRMGFDIGSWERSQ